MGRGVRWAVAAIAGSAVAWGWIAAAVADGTVTGHARLEKVKGSPFLGYEENRGLYESNLFLSPCYASPPVGPSRRVGAPPGEEARGDGYYSIDMPAGVYSVFLNQPEFFIRPKVVTDVVIEDGRTTTQNVDLAIDYSTYIREDQQWTAYDTPWYQTFTATGTSVTGVSVMLAGTNATMAAIAILQDNGDPDVRNWTWLGQRTANTFKANNDNWVRWRSGEIPTVPGTKYAVLVTGLNGGDRRFAPYKRDKDSLSYAGGRAYNSAGVAQDFDLNYVVFSDNDGTRITMCKRGLGLGALVEGNYAQQWGQSFVARGTCLAAADVWAAGVSTWDLDFTWTVREDGPAGALIAAPKTTKAAWRGSGAGLHAVSYCFAEVPLTAGRTYYVEFTNVPGFNPYVMDNDTYDDGMAYLAGAPRSGIDLSMTILEYTAPLDAPQICMQPLSVSASARQGLNPSDGSLTVRNCGAATLNYTITDNVSWLAVDPPAGASAGDTNTHAVHYDAVSLRPGTYTATIVLGDLNARNNPQTVPVTLQVTAWPADFTANGDVDLTDFALFRTCFNGPNRAPASSCMVDADLDDDGDVDLADFAVFRTCFNGPNRLPACR